MLRRAHENYETNSDRLRDWEKAFLSVIPKRKLPSERADDSGNAVLQDQDEDEDESASGDDPEHGVR